MASFDRFVVVDWSAASKPCQGTDSVWICSLGADGCRTGNPRTRGAAAGMVRELLTESVSRRERVLIGFDFPYGYPAGFAAALGLRGVRWRAIWELLTAEITDDPDTNLNNRFEVAARINGRLAAQAAFWGCPTGRDYGHLPARRTVTYREADGSPGLAQWRAAEDLLRRRGLPVQPAWKLYGAGSVGGQALTGIPVLARLRFDPALAAVSQVWPFEPLPARPRPGEPLIVHAEVWPSLYDFRRQPGGCKDEKQVRHLSSRLRALDRAGTLATLLGQVPAPGAEEGWILGAAPERITGRHHSRHLTSPGMGAE